MEKFYLYLISTGAYSDYRVEALAIHKKQLVEIEIKALAEEVKRKYIEAGYPTQNLRVDSGKIWGILYQELIDKGFQVVYPVGEFHFGDYGQLEDISGTVPWMPNDKEPSALRIGLA